MIHSSKRRNVFGIHPLFISTLYILIALLLAGVARKICNAILKDNIFKQMVLEFIATLELCAACFELIVGKWFVIYIQDHSKKAYFLH